MNEKKVKKWAGFTLVEMLTVLTIIGIMSAVMVDLFDETEQDPYESTREIMAEVQTAILGNTGMNRFPGVPVDGYVGDMGELPELNEHGQPEALWAQGTCPQRVYDASARIWAGWNGPYIEPPDGGSLIDGWGNGLLFERRGKDLVITSCGEDRKLGGSGNGADLVLEIKEEDYMAPVGGRLPAGSGLSGSATLYYPSGGLLKSMQIASMGASSQFMSQTNDVPVGLRSIVAAVDGEDRRFVFVVRPTMNWLGKLQ
jgi:prepilin-type N-terminal cleavage/methylation domain-containing protein